MILFFGLKECPFHCARVYETGNITLHPTVALSIPVRVQIDPSKVTVCPKKNRTPAA